MNQLVYRLPHVIAAVGLRRTAILDGVKRGTFPAPIKLSEKAVGWTVASIENWVAGRVAASQPDHQPAAHPVCEVRVRRKRGAQAAGGAAA